jgi:hypothetical protein
MMVVYVPVPRDTPAAQPAPETAPARRQES